MSVILLAACSKNSNLENLTAFQSEKKSLLAQRLNKFNKAIYWGSMGEALEYVAVDAQLEFRNDLRKRKKSERLVELNVETTDFDREDSDIATVDVEVKYFQQPTNVVKTRVETQRWEYHRFSGGWKYHGTESVVARDTESSMPELSPSRGRLDEPRPTGRY